MAIRTVGLQSPGDMGHSIGQVLHAHGLQVLTCLEGRSYRSRALAAQAGIEDGGSLEDIVQQADLFISVLVPSSALDVAARGAPALRPTRASILYADCNAIAPQTVRAVADTIESAGGRMADVGIIGPPPRKPGTKFYVSGPGAAEFSELASRGLDVRVLDGAIGRASALKMCYGALTKGLQALATELMVAARLAGVDDALRAEQEETMSEVLGWLQGNMPIMPPKAYRWVGEMEEIASFFADLGMSPDILNGAAEMYRFVIDTPIGQESPESRDPNRDMYGVIDALADELRATEHVS
jgi:3-hydroxyisobutyrate dehydrogenase-like beta-hydroxyacid dehydrogenase